MKSADLIYSRAFDVIFASGVMMDRIRVRSLRSGGSVNLRLIYLARFCGDLIGVVIH
jgi:hypothetical protein